MNQNANYLCQKYLCLIQNLLVVYNDTHRTDCFKRTSKVLRIITSSQRIVTKGRIVPGEFRPLIKSIIIIIIIIITPGSKDPRG